MESALGREPSPIQPPGPDLSLVPPKVAPQISSLSRPAARLYGAARVLSRHLDELATPARTRLLAEMEKAADALARALLREEGAVVPPVSVAEDIDEMLLLRCNCL